MKIKTMHDFDDLEAHRVGNVDALDALFDTKPYLTNKSDIVALLVFAASGRRAEPDYAPEL